MKTAIDEIKEIAARSDAAAEEVRRAVRNPAGIGHNKPPRKGGPISADRLKSMVERIEKLEEERKALGEDIKDIYSEAKGVGYDTKTIRRIVALRKMDAADRAEAAALLDTYAHALGLEGAFA